MTNQEYKMLKAASGAIFSGSCNECKRKKVTTQCCYCEGMIYFCCNCLTPHYAMHQLAGEPAIVEQYVKADLDWAKAAQVRRPKRRAKSRRPGAALDNSSTAPYRLNESGATRQRED